ncbi:hypothetical protein GH733_012793 [Mirounga leonina]|nr:hypothetical protein GH733_012793 [Mirounga leonina]
MQGDAQAGSEVGSEAEGCTEALHRVPRPPGLLHTGLRRGHHAPALAYLRLRRMGPQVPSAPPALWVLGCLALSLWLWTLCTACHRKRVQRQRARPQGGVMPAEASLLRRHHFCTLSKSDTRLHELHGGPAGCRGEPSREGRDRGMGGACTLEQLRGSPRIGSLPQ